MNRYTISPAMATDGRPVIEIEKSARGEWVKYSDVADLETQLALYKKALGDASLKLAQKDFPRLCDEDKRMVAEKIRDHFLQNVDPEEALADGPIRS